MAARRKINPHAKLKLLPEETQQTIFEYCQLNSYDATVDWLKEEMNIVACSTTVQKWFGWRMRKLDIEEAENEAQEMEEMLSKPGLQLTPEQLTAIGNAIFINRATKSGDAKTFVAVAAMIQRNQKMISSQQEHAEKLKLAQRRLTLKGKEIRLAERRVEVLEKKIKDAATVLDEAEEKGGLTEETREHIRAALGMT